MKVDVTQIIRDLSGQPLAGKPEDATLRKVCLEVLMNTLRGDESMSGAGKAQLYALGMRIHSEDHPDLSAEDLSLVKDRIGRAYAPLVVGQAYALLDPQAPRAVSVA